MNLRSNDWRLSRLRAAGVPSPEADLRTMAAVAQERGEPDDVVDGWVSRRVQREPLQVILGETWFRNVRVACAPGVFVPRPETEIVAGLAIAAAGRAWPDPLVVEPCTGTGAITCALVTEVPGVRVLATDVQPAAVALAEANIRAALAGEAGVLPAEGARATVRGGSLLDTLPISVRGEVDVLVSNPPYLPASDIGTWEPEVADNDGTVALVGGPHGNEVVDELLELASDWLRPGGTVVLEVDPRLAAAAADHARAVGLVEVTVHPDLTGRDRAVVARRAP